MTVNPTLPAVEVHQNPDRDDFFRSHCLQYGLGLSIGIHKESQVRGVVKHISTQTFSKST